MIQLLFELFFRWLLFTQDNPCLLLPSTDTDKTLWNKVLSLCCLESKWNCNSENQPLYWFSNRKSNWISTCLVSYLSSLENGVIQSNHLLLVQTHLVCQYSPMTLTKWCYCQGEEHGLMIACDNDKCSMGWFHLDLNTSLRLSSTVLSVGKAIGIGVTNLLCFVQNMHVFVHQS